MKKNIINLPKYKYILFFTLTFILALLFIFLESNNFLRSYATDFFAVMYVYFFLRLIGVSFMNALAATFVTSYLIEFIQYLKLFEGKEHLFITVIIGQTFDLGDFLAYNAGLFFCVTIEFLSHKTLNIY